MNKKLLFNEFGETIRRLRLEQNLTQAAIAEKAGLERHYVSMLETGARKPSLDMAIRIAEAFEMRPGKLVDLVLEE